MKSGKSAQLLQSLQEKKFKERVAQAQRFEAISGGGVGKMFERLITAPRIYIPYILHAKLGLHHLHRSRVELFWGRTIRIPIQDYDALIIYMYGGLFGSSERRLSTFLIKNLKPEDVFYDVGANRGFYTFLASELCKEVHTFEPMRELAQAIEENTYRDSAVTVNAVALSDKDGTIDFYVMESTMLNTINASVAAEGNHRSVRVPTMMLDTYVATHTRPTFLKIDAEGAEEQIIRGGMKFFSSNTPTIAMEVWGKENKWELSMKAVETLYGMGYRSLRITDGGTLEEVRGDLSSMARPDGAENFVFRK